MEALRRYVVAGCLGLMLVGCGAATEMQGSRAWEGERDQRGEADGGMSESSVLGEQATLEEYVRFALLNNAGLRAAFARWKGALEEVAPARTLADPRLTYGYFLREVETRVGPQEQRFSLAQTFPWKGKLDLRGKIALQKAEAERARYEGEREELILRVRKSYYELYYLERALAVTGSNVHLLGYLEEVARTGYSGGRGKQGAVIKAQVELGKLEDRLRRLRQMRRPLVARFNAALGRPLAAGEPVVDEELLRDRLRAGNPELNGLQAEIAAERLAGELAGKEGLPDLTVGIDYVVTGGARGVSKPEDSGKDPLVGMVSLGLPIHRGAYRAREQAARARERAALLEREERENNLLADLEMALFGARDGEERIGLYRDVLIPRAEQALGVAQQAFVAGETGFLELIDAQRVLLEFELARQRAVADRAIHLAEIERLVGREGVEK